MGAYITLAEAKRHLNEDRKINDLYIDYLIDLVEELVLTEIQGSVNGEGTVTTAGTTALVGLLTNFDDYIIGDTIKVDGETLRTIATITDETHLTVTVAFTTSVPEKTYIMHPGIPSPIPVGLKHDMFLLLAHFYNNREATLIGVNIIELPIGHKYLYLPHKNWTIV
jgi:hypothetical protein